MNAARIIDLPPKRSSLGMAEICPINGRSEIGPFYAFSSVRLATRAIKGLLMAFPCGVWEFGKSFLGGAWHA